MRVGIIGLGSIGTRHAKNALAMGHELMVWDVNTPIGAPKACDAMVVCTPANTHAAVAETLLAAGYAGPLLVEKPLALSVDECDVFRSWPSPVTMTGYQLRFHAEVDRLKRMVPSPSKGSLSLECDMSDWPGYNYGPAVFECSHEIDLALFFGAEPILSSAVLSGSVMALSIGGFGVVLNWESDRSYRRWSIANDFGHADDAEFKSPLDTEMYVDELAHFLDCAETNQPTITPFADGIRVVQVCEDAVKMANA